jgi:hypothetical protein
MKWKIIIPKAVELETKADLFVDGLIAKIGAGLSL